MSDTPARDINLRFSYTIPEDTGATQSEYSVAVKTHAHLGHIFRQVESLYGKKKGSIVFFYNHKQLKETDTPAALEMKDTDIIKCSVVLKIVITHPTLPSKFFTVDYRDVALKFATLFAAYGNATNLDPGALLHFTLNGRHLEAEDSVVETLGINDDGIIIVATPADDSTAAPTIETAVPTTPLPENEDHINESSLPLTETPEAMLLRLRNDLLKAEVRWLSKLIHAWPQPPASPDDADIVWHFARGFMIWRDSLMPQVQTEDDGDPPGLPPENSGTLLAAQLNAIATLEELHQQWKAESLDTWNAYRSSPPPPRQPTSSSALHRAIQKNTTTRLRREAKIISILGLLISTWTNQLAGGWAFLCQGPGLYSDLRILKECREAIDQKEGVAAILERKWERVHAVSSLSATHKATSSQASDAEAAGVEEFLREENTPSSSTLGTSPPPERRQSGWLKQKPTLPLPQSKTPSHDRPPVFARPLDIVPSRTRKSRREMIQNEWNRLARDAQAARIEFINDVDDEEVPPGIGVLFPYLERKYLFDIGIAEPSPMAGCQCDGVAGCSKASKCGCCTERTHAYTAQGLFAFNTEGEITECNSYCSCPPKCINRVAQFPRQLPVQIFKTEKRGWGVRMPVTLVRGRVAGLYSGLLIRREEADKLSGSRASYCFDLDVNEAPDEDPPENAYSVDAYACGNWTRFINHSCNPNLEIISVVYDTMPQDNMPYLALVATKTIPAYTELTFDYNPSHKTEFEAKRYKEKSRSIMKKSKKQTLCLCGESQCRKWLPVVA